MNDDKAKPKLSIREKLPANTVKIEDPRYEPAGTADDGKDEQTSTSADGSSDTVEDGQKPSGEDTPQTGDNSNSALWIALMLTAGTALTAAAIFSRKKKYSR